MPPARLPLPLRRLHTVVEAAAGNNGTLLMPVPVELLRFTGRASRAPALRMCPGADPQVPDGIRSGFAAGPR